MTYYFFNRTMCKYVITVIERGKAIRISTAFLQLLHQAMMIANNDGIKEI
ncbi:MAG: hypothetical protein J6M93_06410 [Succinivibrio sp.]|nr:hypothetical protein [Succinivibrio sp.]